MSFDDSTTLLLAAVGGLSLFTWFPDRDFFVILNFFFQILDPE